MAYIFRLPAIGDTMVEGEIVQWLVAVGDVLELDQPICEIETDKSVVELTTPFRGAVLHLAGEAGSVIEVGQALIIVGKPGEPLPDLGLPNTPAAVAATPVFESSVAHDSNDPANDSGLLLSPVVRRLAVENRLDVDSLAGTGPGGRVTRVDVERAIAETEPAPTQANGSTLAMPNVRKRARELSLDLNTVSGTGPRASVTLADLEKSVTVPRAERRERLSAMRRSIAAHLTKSVQEIPQFTSMIDVDASALLATRRALREQLDGPLPIDALLMKLMTPVLADHPVMTAKLDGDEIVFFDRFDIGVAVDTPDGLMVPVVRDAERKSVSQLAADITRLADAARARTIAPNDLSGATCTLNNVGSLGVLAGTPILPVGTSVIVAFGQARQIVQLRDGCPVSVPTMTISATFDHRLIDGGDSGRFLAQLKAHLEVPALGMLL